MKFLLDSSRRAAMIAALLLATVACGSENSITTEDAEAALANEQEFVPGHYEFESFVWDVPRCSFIIEADGPVGVVETDCTCEQWWRVFPFGSGIEYALAMWDRMGCGEISIVPRGEATDVP